jgi:hypothetical protein
MAMKRSIVKLKEEMVVGGRIRGKGEIIRASETEAEGLVEHDEANMVVDAETLASRIAAEQAKAERLKEKSARKRRRVEFVGRIELMPDGFIGDWIVAGCVVRVTGGTKLSGKPPAVGLVAEVEGIDWGDHIEAEKVKIRKPEKVQFAGEIEGLP